MISDIVEPKTIVYDYLFNYFGGDTFNGHVITGASVQIAIKAYKQDQEVKFTKEPKAIHGMHYNDIYNVAFNRDKLFVVEKNMMTDNVFRLIYGFDRIDAVVVGYTLDKLSGLTKDMIDDCPVALQNLPCSEPIEVTETEFREFIINHLDDFDITDNIYAQCPSVSFV